MKDSDDVSMLGRAARSTLPEAATLPRLARFHSWLLVKLTGDDASTPRPPASSLTMVLPLTLAEPPLLAPSSPQAKM